jgi:hypothetical protein
VPYALAPYANIPLTEDLLELLIVEHESVTVPRLERLWRYYRNALAEPTDGGGSSAPPAQKAGLPQRLTLDQVELERDLFSREIVIENDIAWRVHTLVDFMFPEAPVISSSAADPSKRSQIDAILEAVFDAASDGGGVSLWQNAALLGSVYGHVDFLVNLNPHAAESRPGNAPSKPLSHDLMKSIRSSLSIETVEAPRAIPLLSQNDYRVVDAYILHWRQPVHDVSREGWLSRLTRAIAKPTHSKTSHSERAFVTVTIIISADRIQRYEDGMLVSETVNRLGRIPMVHVQNLPQPLRYEGLSDVKPLIPLQDELNIRLSDRANRVTMQSFRMWLAKGLDGFIDRPVGPGQMWMTDNPDASIESFGGDADSPSERQHMEDLREALDRASGVTPAAAGHIKARVGNLTSENALRISLMGTIAKIKRKRITYGAGIRKLCEMVLHALDVQGLYRTQPDERGVTVTWTDPIPADETRRIQDALDKAQLGIPLEVLRAELGYESNVQSRPGARRLGFNSRRHPCLNKSTFKKPSHPKITKFPHPPTVYRQNRPRKRSRRRRSTQGPTAKRHILTFLRM